jgi:hypothetical protein
MSTQFISRNSLLFLQEDGKRGKITIQTKKAGKQLLMNMTKIIRIAEVS